ncbi:zinc-dependent alcohol dehydrogenase [Paenibacillus lignilyticus]|uniref:Zinc-binding alcohol dehydrogenase n=1 Tax=Paenibacillus lignilyticus TaxID=1172615 RepID=A0ABS5CFS5_9BACL|nr:zinc-binding alcohol dehydrogenase [Paenibacillus lignilyticus]MBP3964716.1 zinc-binding alcohol dehydrogenase [Paenibacillus lignilyticus]
MTAQRLDFIAPKEVAFAAIDDNKLEAKEVRLTTLYSGISAGTQLTAYRGMNPFVKKQFNPEQRIFTDRIEEESSLYPVRGCWGYEEVGVVSEIGSAVNAIKEGDVVYGTWGHKSSHVVTEDFARDHLLPQGLDPLAGIYSQMGAIALNAILDADIHIGETVAVYGQGVPGQLVAQLARLNGAEVIAIDLDDYRLGFSERFGAAHTINSRNCGDVASRIKELTGGRGADIAIEISGASGALHEAIRSVVYNGRVVTAGFYQGGAKDLYLGEEFHHNRVQLIGSQISGINLQLTNRWDRLRMERTIMELALSGRLKLSELVTHQVPFEQAAEAYRMLDANTEKSLQVVLKF